MDSDDDVKVIKPNKERIGIKRGLDRRARETTDVRTSVPYPKFLFVFTCYWKILWVINFHPWVSLCTADGKHPFLRLLEAQVLFTITDRPENAIQDVYRFVYSYLHWCIGCYGDEESLSGWWMIMKCYYRNWLYVNYCNRLSWHLHIRECHLAINVIYHHHAVSSYNHWILTTQTYSALSKRSHRYEIWRERAETEACDRDDDMLHIALASSMIIDRENDGQCVISSLDLKRTRGLNPNSKIFATPVRGLGAFI